MKFYHRTTEEKWKKIQEEGILFGMHDSYRYTYLSSEDVGDSFGNILLEVDYVPVGINGKNIDNYGFDPPEGEYCWQFSVFIPISIDKVKHINLNYKY